MRGAVLEYLSQNKPTAVGRRELDEIRKHVHTQVRRNKPVSDRYLLAILLETTFEVDRAIGGLPLDLRAKIPVGDLAACKRSLIDLARQYSGTDDPERASDVRRAVRRTKDHLDLAIGQASSPDRLSVQRETVQWLRAWLENPTVFEAWVELRERSIARKCGAKAETTEPPKGS